MSTSSNYEKTIEIGQYGFVRYIDHMGDDAAIVQAARVSYGNGTKTKREDAALIEYLLRNGHTSPFEMVQLKLHIRATIFEARQIVRHRTASWNEISGRYSELPGDFWTPESQDIRGQGSSANKQTSNGTLPSTTTKWASELINKSNQEAYEHYKQLLNIGVAREQARAVLPLSLYTEWYWRIDGNNLMKFLGLRDDSHAQAETQLLAAAIKEIARDLFPGMLEAYDEVYGGARFTKSQLRELVRVMTVGGCKLEELFKDASLSGSRLDDLMRSLSRGL